MLEMIYQAADGSLSQRIVRIKTFNELHVVAYCYERKGFRMFRLDRILSVQYVRGNREKQVY